MWNLLGLAESALGDLDAAATAFRESLAVAPERGDAFVAIAHGNLAEMALRMNDLPTAAVHQRMSLALGLQLGLPLMLAYSMIVAARIEASERRWSTAARLHARADAVLEESGIQLFQDDRIESEAMLAEAREHLGADTFSKECAEGRSMSLADGANLAVEVFSSVRGSRGVQSP
jgi:hypothetical protein